MSLQRQLIGQTFEDGIDTKVDPLKPTNKLDVLENGIFISPGRIRKRNGYQRLAQTIVNGSTIASGAALFAKGNELLLADGANIYSYDAANSALSGSFSWANKGAMASPTVSTTPVVSNQYTIAGQDTAIFGGLQIYVYEMWDSNFGETAKGIGYSIVDRSTGQILVGNTALGSATSVSPRVVATSDGAFWVFYYDSGTFALVAQKILTSTLSVSGSALAVGTIYNGAPRYDVIGGPFAHGVFISGATGAGALTEFAVQSVGISVSTWTYTATNPRSITCFTDRAAADVAYIAVGYTCGFTANTAYFQVIRLGATLKSETSLDGSITAGSSNITGISTSASATAYTFFITGNGNTTRWWYSYVKSVSVTAGYAVGTSSVIARSVSIAGKPLQSGSNVYLPVALDSDITGLGGASIASQNTNYLINTSGNVVARWFATTSIGAYRNYGATISGIQMTPQTVDVGDGTFLLPGVSAYRAVATSGLVALRFGLFGVTLNLTDTTNGYGSAVLANGLHVGGGAMRGYYASTTVEHGYNHAPFSVSGSAAGAAGSLSAGSYQYAVCYEWLDAYGQIHRSAPSTAYTITAAATNTITLTIPTLRLTDKTGGVGEVMITVYRTAANGTTFYQVSNVGTAATALYNSTTANTVTYADGAADTSITGNPQIYTTGGVVPNYPPPPMISPTVWRNRLVGIDSTNPLTLWYSKQVIPTAPVEFSAYFTLNIDPRGGACTAIENLDDKLVVWKADRIFVITGQGPDSTGGQNDFSDAVLVTSDTGCTEPRSIVTTPVGLMFKGRKGIYLLDRSLSVSYVGAEVEAYNGYTVTSADLVANTNQVRFTISNGQALVLDYLMRQWGVFTNHSAVDSVIWQGTYSYLSSSGAVYVETPGVFSDAGAFISLKLTTSWYTFAGQQGFQRLYKILLLGEFDSPHTLTVGLAYDYVPTISQTTTITPSVGTLPYQWRVFPSIQKCEAVQITIYDSPSVGQVIIPGGPGMWAVTSSVGYQADVGEGYNISGLAFEVGMKRGGFRLPASRSAA